MQSHSALSNPSPQFSGRQLAVVLFEIQNPARSVLALLAGAALSTQAIDLQFHVCSNFVLVFFKTNSVPVPEHESQLGLGVWWRLLGRSVITPPLHTTAPAGTAGNARR